MKKLLTSMLVLCLCFCTLLPVLAYFPSSEEDGLECFEIETSMDGYDNYIEEYNDLYNCEITNLWDYSTEISDLSCSISGYNILSSDSVITITNTRPDTDFYIEIHRKAYVINEDGKYQLSVTDWEYSLLRYCGFLQRRMMENTFPEREGIYLTHQDSIVYNKEGSHNIAGNSVSIKASTLIGIDTYGHVSTLLEEKADPGDDVIYQIIILVYPSVTIEDKNTEAICYNYFYKVDDKLAAEIMSNGNINNDSINIANPFTDVTEGSYYYTPVLWALGTGITTGTSATTFEPFATCTRGQVATFLWRAMGCPEPVTTVNPFTDVKESDWFYKAVLWAYENGITTGTSATTFEPYTTCTSAHVITFMWRAMGEPCAVGPSLADSYPDVWYTDALRWADITLLLDGPDTPFSPDNSSPRADIVAYLYHCLS